jgi:hypothetical protein
LNRLRRATIALTAVQVGRTLPLQARSNSIAQHGPPGFPQAPVATTATPCGTAMTSLIHADLTASATRPAGAGVVAGEGRPNFIGNPCFQPRLDLRTHLGQAANRPTVRASGRAGSPSQCAFHCRPPGPPPRFCCAELTSFIRAEGRTVIALMIVHATMSRAMRRCRARALMIRCFGGTAFDRS